jgi:hypothetical protein
MRSILPVSPTQMAMNAWGVVIGRLVLILGGWCLYSHVRTSDTHLSHTEGTAWFSSAALIKFLYTTFGF